MTYYKICVYAIAKNESKNVEEWVKSMNGADKIIVLDTGSEDDTVEKLRSLGVEVYEKHYNHFRFDTARNDCLDLVPDDYDILVSIDLDERFEQENWADILRENWDPNKERVVYNYTWMYTPAGLPALSFLLNKIHKKMANLRWEGAVHEHLWYQNPHTREFEEKDYIDLSDKISVGHHPDRNKPREYLKLLEERIEEFPEDEISWLLCGNEYKILEKYEEALYYYKYGIDNFKDKYDIVTLAGLYYNLGNCYFELNNGVLAWENFSKGIATLPNYRDNYYGIALLMLNNNLIEMALGTVLQALHTTVPWGSWLEEVNMWTFLLYDLLGRIYLAQGNINLAIECAQAALDMDPEHPYLIETLNTYKEIQKKEF